MNVAYINPFITSVSFVLKELVHSSCIVGKPFIKRDGHRFHRLYSHAATIQFSGAVNGMIALDFAEPVALWMASEFSGTPYKKMGEGCADALAEIVNMVAGNAKRQLPGGQVFLSIPKLFRTHQISYPPGASIIVIPFDTNRGRLVIEVALQRRSQALEAEASTPAAQLAVPGAADTLPDGLAA